MSNQKIKELADRALKECDAAGERDIEQYSERLAALVVKACADAADMAQDADCKFPGDYVGEFMGYGKDEGIANWRSQ